MNNQVTLINSLNQEINAELISYFQIKNNNKKYAIYTMNEIVQDGLVKIYIAEENVNGLTVEITPDEWNGLKAILQEIIKKGNLDNITFLPVQGNIKINPEKTLALNVEYPKSAKEVYNNDPVISASKAAISNKDLLSQSFGTQPPIETMQTGTTPSAPVETPVETPVQITDISKLQGTTSIENNPANLSMEATSSVNDDLSVLGINPATPKMPETITESSGVVEEQKDSNNSMNPLTGLESLIPDTNLNVTPLAAETASEVNKSSEIVNSVASDFNVNPGINYFDLPREETLTPTQATTDLNIANTSSTITPITEEKTEAPATDFLGMDLPKDLNPVEENTTEEISSNLDDDIYQAEIAIEKEGIELLEKYIDNRKKKIEVLEQKRKKDSKVVEFKQQQEQQMGPSASELFDSNGTLDENKVLEKLPESIMGLGLAA